MDVPSDQICVFCVVLMSQCSVNMILVQMFLFTLVEITKANINGNFCGFWKRHTHVNISHVDSC